MTLMNIPQLIQFFDGIPRRDDLATALASTKSSQRGGKRVYDAVVAGEALVKYYQRKAQNAMLRYENRRFGDSTHSRELAEQFEARAKSIAAKLKELRDT